VPSQLTTGVFLNSYLELAAADPGQQHSAWVEYRTADRWQWAESCSRLAARLAPGQPAAALDGLGL
jgi:hypothetical protein